MHDTWGMRVAVMTAGSRGDIAPYTGLAHALAAAGHEVTVATHGSFRPLAEAAGVGFRALPVDPRAELESGRGRALHDTASGPGKILHLVRMARAVVGGMTAPLIAQARESEVLLLSSSLAPLGHTIGRGLGLPTLGAFLQPLHPTRAFGPSVLGPRSWGPTGNLLAGHLVNTAVDRVFSDAVRAGARELGLPRRTVRTARYRSRERERLPVLHGFSPLVVPRPRDWRPGLTIGGYWWPHDPPGSELPPRVQDFLAAGPPPVFLGLGSATVPDREHTSALLVRAVRKAGLRGIVQRGWAGLDGAAGADGDTGTGGGADDLLTVDEVPHALLFPHMAAVVHHCGAGTTAAGLRAGVPAVPMPVQFDGGFWAARLTALGVAPAVVPLRQLTVDRLAAALTAAVREPRYARQAARLAERLRAEDGVAPVLAALRAHERAG